MLVGMKYVGAFVELKRLILELRARIEMKKLIHICEVILLLL